MTENVLSSRQGAVLRLQINRPEKRNALTAEMYDAIATALEQAQADDSVRVVTLTGTPGCFTAGNDLTSFMNPTDGLKQVVRFLNVIAAFEKPLVAVVSGLAVGVGVTMLLHCDLVYAAQSATFRTPFVDLGLVPEAGSSLLMPLLMGHVRAAELLLLGETLHAEKACNYGLINAVFADDELERDAMAKAQTLAARAPAAMRASKKLMRRARISAVQETMAAEAEVFAERLGSPEVFEAIQAFMQRRKPNFT